VFPARARGGVVLLGRVSPRSRGARPSRQGATDGAGEALPPPSLRPRGAGASRGARGGPGIGAGALGGAREEGGRGFGVETRARARRGASAQPGSPKPSRPRGAPLAHARL